MGINPKSSTLSQKSMNITDYQMKKKIPGRFLSSEMKSRSMIKQEKRNYRQKEKKFYRKQLANLKDTLTLTFYKQDQMHEFSDYLHF